MRGTRIGPMIQICYHCASQAGGILEKLAIMLKPLQLSGSEHQHEHLLPTDWHCFLFWDPSSALHLALNPFPDNIIACLEENAPCDIGTATPLKEMLKISLDFLCRLRPRPYQGLERQAAAEAPIT